MYIKHSVCFSWGHFHSGLVAWKPWRHPVSEDVATGSPVHIQMKNLLIYSHAFNQSLSNKAHAECIYEYYWPAIHCSLCCSTEIRWRVFFWEIFMWSEVLWKSKVVWMCAFMCICTTCPCACLRISSWWEGISNRNSPMMQRFVFVTLPLRTTDHEVIHSSQQYIQVVTFTHILAWGYLEVNVVEVSCLRREMDIKVKPAGNILLLWVSLLLAHSLWVCTWWEVILLCFKFVY